MKAVGILLFLVIAGSALLASHSHKPFELRIDANPGAWQAVDEPDAGPAAWPANALNRPNFLMCRPMVITVGPDMPKPIVRT